MGWKSVDAYTERWWTGRFWSIATRLTEEGMHQRRAEIDASKARGRRADAKFLAVTAVLVVALVGLASAIGKATWGDFLWWSVINLANPLPWIVGAWLAGQVQDEGGVSNMAVGTVGCFLLVGAALLVVWPTAWIPSPPDDMVCNDWGTGWVTCQ